MTYIVVRPVERAVTPVRARPIVASFNGLFMGFTPPHQLDGGPRSVFQPPRESRLIPPRLPSARLPRHSPLIRGAHAADRLVVILIISLVTLAAERAANRKVYQRVAEFTVACPCGVVAGALCFRESLVTILSP